MEYLSTRSGNQFVDSAQAVLSGLAPDGGLYVPETLPRFTREEIEALAMKNPNQAVADILNLFFDGELNRWDVDFSTGRYPVRLSSMVRRIAIAECWHNVDWEFDRTVSELAGLIRGSKNRMEKPGEWCGIAVRIAVLFGIFGELMRDGAAAADKKVDVAVPSGDFSAAMAVWYARGMGLPIGTIIICCNENNNLWTLIRQGEMRTGIGVKKTATPACDYAVPPGLERLAHACGGYREAERFAQTAAEGKAYFPDEVTLKAMQEGIYVSVVSQSRVEATIPTIYKNHNYVFGPYSALCHAGLSDYRSHTGLGSYALILSERGALRDDAFVARELNMAVATLHNIL